jgi:hypothetical protein
LFRTFAGDAVADRVEPAELLDVDVDHLAGTVAFVSPGRLGRLECRQPVEAQAPKDAADRCRGKTQLVGDLLAGAALAAQGLDGGACGLVSLVGR